MYVMHQSSVSCMCGKTNKLHAQQLPAFSSRIGADVTVVCTGVQCAGPLLRVMVFFRCPGCCSCSHQSTPPGSATAVRQTAEQHSSYLRRQVNHSSNKIKYHYKCIQLVKIFLVTALCAKQIVFITLCRSGKHNKKQNDNKEV